MFLRFVWSGVIYTSFPESERVKICRVDLYYGLCNTLTKDLIIFLLDFDFEMSVK